MDDVWKWWPFDLDARRQEEGGRGGWSCAERGKKAGQRQSWLGVGVVLSPCVFNGEGSGLSPRTHEVLTEAGHLV